MWRDSSFLNDDAASDRVLLNEDRRELALCNLLGLLLDVADVVVLLTSKNCLPPPPVCLLESFSSGMISGVRGMDPAAVAAADPIWQLPLAIEAESNVKIGRGLQDIKTLLDE